MLYTAKAILKKNPVLRSGIIKTINSFYTLIYYISPRLFTQMLYKRVLGSSLNLTNPRHFNEKIQWLKLNWRHPLVVQCGDKYTVRAYVESCGYKDILPELYGVFEHSHDVDFRTFPDRFALKCTHGCGFNIICRDKKVLDQRETVKQLSKWMKQKYGVNAGEIHYDKMMPRIICESYLDDGTGLLPIDYKIFCFHGKPLLIMTCTDRALHTQYNYYDFKWNKVHLTKDDAFNRDLERPISLEKMYEIAEALAQPFPFVRIDLYEIKGEVVFGEMTFTPAGGMDRDYTDEASLHLGSLIQLPRVYYDNVQHDKVNSSA